MFTQCLGAGGVWDQTNQPPQAQEPISSIHSTKPGRIASFMSQLVGQRSGSVAVVILKWRYRDQQPIQAAGGDQTIRTRLEFIKCSKKRSVWCFTFIISTVSVVLTTWTKHLLFLLFVHFPHFYASELIIVTACVKLLQFKICCLFVFYQSQLSQASMWAYMGTRSSILLSTYSGSPPQAHWFVSLLILNFRWLRLHLLSKLSISFLKNSSIDLTGNYLLESYSNSNTQKMKFLQSLHYIYDWVLPWHPAVTTSLSVCVCGHLLTEVLEELILTPGQPGQ